MFSYTAFEAGKLNGGCLRTVITRVVNYQIHTLLRGAMREEKNKQAYTDAHQLEPENEMHQSAISADEQQVNMRMDIHDAMAGFDQTDKDICEFLALGHSERAIAEKLGLSRYMVKQKIADIRDVFSDAGLNGWVTGAE